MTSAAIRQRVQQGQQYGRLTVLRFLERTPSGAYWLCACDCGNTRRARERDLRGGVSKSCGCLTREWRSKRNTVHGLSHTPTWAVWAAMRARCSDITHRDAKNYVARGISVCNRWASFEAFLADMGPRPSAQHTLDRINNDLGYSPENCRWATRREQNNNKRTNVFFEHGGQRKTYSQWAAEYGVCPHRLRYRLLAGWGFERSVSEPKRSPSVIRP